MPLVRSHDTLGHHGHRRRVKAGFPAIGNAVAPGQTLALLAPRLEAADVALVSSFEL
jgi:hypothetical protein